jgi:ABC-type transport system involved in cytochrome bd biosynthesis fused ATPase/permease subunit
LLSEINLQALFFIVLIALFILLIFVLISKFQLKLGVARLENDRSRVKAIRNLHALNHELKYIGNRNWFINDFCVKLSNVVKSAKISNFLQQIPRQIIEILGLLLIAVIYINLSTSGMTSNEINVFFAVFIAGALRVVPSVTKILTSIQSIIYTSPSYFKINETLFEINNNGESLLPSCVLSESDIEIFIDYRIIKPKADVKEARYNLLKNRLNIIVGESGVGKTTFLHSLCHSAFNSNISALRCNSSPVSLLTQESSVIEGSFSENIFLYDAVHKNLIESSQDYINLINLLRLKDIAVRFESAEYIQEGGTNISGGEARRICLARHLLKKPSILFLDEPTVGLSQEAEIEIFELLKDLSSNVTIVAVTHSNIAANFADHTIKL